MSAWAVDCSSTASTVPSTDTQSGPSLTRIEIRGSRRRLVGQRRPTRIKIDREIIRGIGDKKGDAKQALVEAFVSFGRRIGAELVAEGIETRRELIMLRDLGVTYGQGYLLGKPSPEPSAPRPLASLLPSGSMAGQALDDGPKKRARAVGRVAKAGAGA